MDSCLVILLGSAAASVSVTYGARLDPALYKSEFLDIYFDGDIGDTVASLTLRQSFNDGDVHPLASLFLRPFAGVLKRLYGDPQAAARGVIALAGFFWVVVLFATLRLLGCRRLDATLFSALALVSAAAMFWLPVPETFLIGSLTMLLALMLVALAEHQPVSALWYLVVSVGTFSIVITNWMAGVLTAFIARPWRQAAQITAGAFAAVVALWMIQSSFYPPRPFFVNQVATGWWLEYAFRNKPFQVINVFLFHSMVMPRVELLLRSTSFTHADFTGPLWMLTVQASRPGSGGVLSIVAVALWTLLLGFGCVALVQLRNHLRFRVLLGALVLGQVSLHLLFGLETFEYAAVFAPLLVILAALTTLTTRRRVVVMLAAGLLVAAAVNNYQAFSRATVLVRTAVMLRSGQ